MALAAPAMEASAQTSVPEGLMRAQDAVAAARGEIPRSQFTDDQQKIIRLLSAMRKTSRGREMTERAVEQSVLYGIDNNMPGAAYYDRAVNIIALELRDDGRQSGDAVRDLTSEKEFQDFEAALIKIFFHEHVHLYQAKMWNTMKPPPGLSSYDNLLWFMAREAQAIVVADMAIEEYFDVLAGSVMPGDRSSLADRFAVAMFMDHFHVRYYGGTAALRCDNGARMLRDDFVRAFGQVPGRTENFMEKEFPDMDSIYRMFEKNQLVGDAARRLGCGAGEPAQAEPAAPGVS